MNTEPSPAAPPVQRKHRAATLQHWQAILADFNASGLSVSEFCRQRGIVEQSLYRWRIKLATCLTQVSASGISGAAAFVPVVIRPGTADPLRGDDSLQVDLRGGRVLRLPMSMPAQRVAELVHALEGLA